MKVSAVSTVVAVSLFACVSAEAAVLPASAMVSVVSVNSTTSYTTTMFVGLNTGGAGISRTFLQFQLPTFVPGTGVTAAAFSGVYDQDWVTADDRTFSFYEAADTVSELTTNWNTQPAFGGPVIATWNAAPAVNGATQNFGDISTAMDAAYRGDGKLTLAFKADDEVLANNNQSWEYFRRAFSVNYTVAAVPEPSLLGGVAVGCVVLLRRRRGN